MANKGKGYLLTDGQARVLRYLSHPGRIGQKVAMGDLLRELHVDRWSVYSDVRGIRLALEAFGLLPKRVLNGVSGHYSGYTLDATAGRLLTLELFMSPVPQVA